MDNLSEVIVEVSKMQTTMDHLSERVKSVEEQQTALIELAASVKVLAYKQESLGKTQADMKSDIQEIKQTVQGIASVETLQKDVEELKMKPAKRWDSVVDKVLMLLIGGIVGFFLMKLGL